MQLDNSDIAANQIHHESLHVQTTSCREPLLGTQTQPDAQISQTEAPVVVHERQRNTGVEFALNQNKYAEPCALDTKSEKYRKEQEERATAWVCAFLKRHGYTSIN